MRLGNCRVLAGRHLARLYRFLVDIEELQLWTGTNFFRGVDLEKNRELIWEGGKEES